MDVPAGGVLCRCGNILEIDRVLLCRSGCTFRPLTFLLSQGERAWCLLQLVVANHKWPWLTSPIFRRGLNWTVLAMTTKVHTSGFRNFGFRHQASGDLFPNQCRPVSERVLIHGISMDERRPSVHRRKPPIHWLEVVAAPRQNSWYSPRDPIHPMTRLLMPRPGCDTDRVDMFRAKQNNSIAVRKAGEC
jgi:hypothetical protein